MKAYSLQSIMLIIVTAISDTVHRHSHKVETYKTKLFQQKVYETRTTSGTIDVLTANIMAIKNGCVTIFLNRNILLMKGYLQI